jgi:hypothetical protein
MSHVSKRPENFSDEIYTSFAELEHELTRRQADKGLEEKIAHHFGDNFLKVIEDGPRAVLSRTIATPNAELFYFLDLAKDLNIPPLILEYPDKFVAKNPDKYHLGRLFFYKKSYNLKSYPTSTVRIVDFNNHEGKKFADIPTLWDENIIEFHHQILFDVLPELRDKVVDFSDWFKSSKESSDYYYFAFLSLFVRNGILFENFLVDDKEEEAFIRDKFLPSFYEVEKVFGVKPLIFPLLPFDGEKHPHWLSYHESIKERVHNRATKHDKIL